MDERVVAHFDGDVSRANLHPGRRAHYLEKYAPGTSRSAAA